MENNVLFVDDEVHILKAIKRGLYKEKYNKFFASSPEEALEILEDKDIHVIVTDMKMPKMSGLELLTIVKEKYPDVVKIILSGYTQLQQIIVTINRIDIYKFITKPWDMEEEFVNVIRSAIEIYNNKRENENLKNSIQKKNVLYQNMLKSDNEKLMLMKRNLSFLYTFNDMLVNYFMILGLKLSKNEIDTPEYNAEIQFILNLQLQSIQMMPSKSIGFNGQMINRVMYSYQKKIKEEHGEDSCNLIVTDTTKNITINGEYDFLIFIIKLVVSQYFSIVENDTFDIVLSISEDMMNNKKFLCLVKSDKNVIISNKIRKNGIFMFVEALINSVNGTVMFEKKGDEELFLMKLPTIIESEEGEFDD